MSRATTDQRAVRTLLQVDPAAFFGISRLQRIKDRLDIALSRHAYTPKLDDPLSDWVASVAVPAFKAVSRQPGRAMPVESFCVIGTGCGLDALAAIEILGATQIGITDVHPDVVATAAENIAGNLRPGHRVAIDSGHGDLLEPLLTHPARYDLIYENLPNIPLSDGAGLYADQTSATHVAPRREPLPQPVKTQLLALHYLALVQAKQLLRPGGSVLSTIGGRVPLEALLKMAETAGFTTSILTYTWKLQAEPEEILSGYASWQHGGLGPFHFYPAEVLQETFFDAAGEVAAGDQALAIERALAFKRLDAITAYQAFRHGARIGHTVAVLESRPRAG